MNDSRLTELLTRLEQHWTEEGAPIAEHLRPGVSPERLNAAEGTLGFALPREVRDWFSWHDGVEIVPGVCTTMPNLLRLCSLEAALETRLELLAWDEEDARIAGFVFQPSWLPITIRDKRQLAVDCAPNPDRLNGEAPVHDADFWGDPWEWVRMPSMTAMAELWWSMVKDGYWRYSHETGDWEDHFAEIPLPQRLTGVV